MRLTPDEIAALVRPLVQPAAQVRYLRSRGFEVLVGRDGRPAVVQRVAVETSAPHREALLKRYGKTPKKQPA